MYTAQSHCRPGTIFPPVGDASMSQEFLPVQIEKGDDAITGFFGSVIIAESLPAFGLLQELKKFPLPVPIAGCLPGPCFTPSFSSWPERWQRLKICSASCVIRSWFTSAGSALSRPRPCLMAAASCQTRPAWTRSVTHWLDILLYYGWYETLCPER